MFGSSILDVLLGVVFTFLGVSLAASAITEAIASALKLRQATLLQGIEALLNDPGFDGLARALYNHALVNPLAPGTARTEAELTTKPAYIESRHFAVALIDVLQAKAPDKPLAEIVAEIPDAQLRSALSALMEHGTGDLAAFQAALGAWFDGAMDRLGGWYKRRTQAISFAVALAVAAVLNADALHVTAVLWSRPAMVNALTAGLQGDAIGLPDALARLDAGSLIGWAGWADDPRNTTPGLLLMLVGWAVVAAASLFGAPFWFDTLQRIAWVRGTGEAAGDGRNGGAASHQASPQ